MKCFENTDIERQLSLKLAFIKNAYRLVELRMKGRKYVFLLRLVAKYFQLKFKSCESCLTDNTFVKSPKSLLKTILDKSTPRQRIYYYLMATE